MKFVAIILLGIGAGLPGALITSNGHDGSLFSFMGGAITALLCTHLFTDI